MKQFNQYIQEKLKITKDTKINNDEENKKILNKWYEKCKDLSCAGTFGLTDMHLIPSDFEGFTEDMRKAFIPEGTSIWGDICRARYNIIQAVIEGNIDKMINIINDNYFNYLFAHAHPDSEYVYGSYLLDCWLAYELYDYLSNNSKKYTQQKFALIFRLDDRLSWVNDLKKNLNELKRIF